MSIYQERRDVNAGEREAPERERYILRYVQGEDSTQQGDPDRGYGRMPWMRACMAGEAAAPGRHKGDVTFPCHGDVWRDIKEIQSIEEEIHMDTGRRMEDEFNRSVRALLSWEDVKDRVYPCLAPRRWKKSERDTRDI